MKVRPTNIGRNKIFRKDLDIDLKRFWWGRGFAQGWRSWADGLPSSSTVFGAFDSVSWWGPWPEGTGAFDGSNVSAR